MREFPVLRLIFVCCGSGSFLFTYFNRFSHIVLIFCSYLFYSFSSKVSVVYSLFLLVRVISIGLRSDLQAPFIFRVADSTNMHRDRQIIQKIATIACGTFQLVSIQCYFSNNRPFFSWSSSLSFLDCSSTLFRICSTLFFDFVCAACFFLSISL